MNSNSWNGNDEGNNSYYEVKLIFICKAIKMRLEKLVLSSKINYQNSQSPQLLKYIFFAYKTWEFAPSIILISPSFWFPLFYKNMQPFKTKNSSTFKCNTFRGQKDRLEPKKLVLERGWIGKRRGIF